jgi:hypothetical protein
MSFDWVMFIIICLVALWATYKLSVWLTKK